MLKSTTLNSAWGPDMLNKFPCRLYFHQHLNLIRFWIEQERAR